ncbi:MAG: penicillin acylase family protein [Bacteroidota bacterium]|nr:penicillin acylase family protein [Bacteroidota bacterium]
MLYRKIIICFLIFPIFFLNSQSIDIDNIEIVRDSFGVPHIYAKTDAELSYGLAWAHAEDDFKTIQEAYLAGNALLSKHIGIRGAPIDFLSQLIRPDDTIDSLYKTLDKNFEKVVQGYANGLNSFAINNPDQVLVDKLFPITPRKMLKYSLLQLFIFSEGEKAVLSIFNNKAGVIDTSNDVGLGSNLFAFSSKKTKNNETFLAINTHQPLEGPTSWYEVHLVSEQGTNIIGATFPGAPCVLTGTNQYLGWTHTVNYPDKTDIYQLEMAKNSKLKYIVDDKILKLEKFRGKAFIKILGIPIKVGKRYYRSIYGPTLKNKNGFYSVRTPSLFKIKALEQWWKMNKAKTFDEFYEILKMNEIPGFNFGYADKNDNIFYISNGIIPVRNEKYNWRGILPGNTRETLWTEYHSTEELPQVLNPESGYIYNANNTPFKSTSINENPKNQDFPKEMGYSLFDNNRSTRIYELIESYEKIDFSDFKSIKFDYKFPTPFKFNFVDVNQIMEMNPEEYPHIAELIKEIQNWDRSTNSDSLGAGIFAMFYYNLGNYIRKPYINRKLSNNLIAQMLSDVKAYMIKHFKKTNVTLGEYQKLVRGNKEIPIWGMPDVITAMTSSKHVNGKRKITHGESYIQLVKFSNGIPQIESIMSYGNSENPDSPHYDDQMEMFSKFETKKMSFDKDFIYRNSQKIYNPK